MTYNSSRALYAILGFWLRVFMGVDNVIRNHNLHPYNRFEKDLFRLLESHGLDYRRCNRLGDRTASYDVDDPKTYKNLREWVPAWCFSFIRWALRNHGGKCPLKIDWFSTRGLGTKNPSSSMSCGNDVPCRCPTTTLLVWTWSCRATSGLPWRRVHYRFGMSGSKTRHGTLKARATSPGRSESLLWDSLLTDGRRKSQTSEFARKTSACMKRRVKGPKDRGAARDYLTDLTRFSLQAGPHHFMLSV